MAAGTVLSEEVQLAIPKEPQLSLFYYFCEILLPQDSDYDFLAHKPILIRT